MRHGLGETDDHTWVWRPATRTIVGGDFIVSSLPNAGTPFRVQRYIPEWADALEEMAELEPGAVARAVRLKADLLDARARATRSFVAANVLRSAAVALRDPGDRPS